MTKPAKTTRELIDALTLACGCGDAETAIRAKAKELIDLNVATFGDPSLPIDVDVLASLRGIGRSADAPIYSDDAEIAPDGQGGVSMRVNPDRPETRQRFSIAHEICHTFFPDYGTKTWCRTDARYRNRANPEDYLEMLCDIGAAELLFPQPWFGRDAASVACASDIAQLASTYYASREATIRRYAETSEDTVAAVFFVWKLKPSQRRTIGRRNQMSLLGTDPDQEIRDAIRLRIEYPIPSASFAAEGYFLPKDKSVESDGPIFEAAATGMPVDGECHLDLGQSSGTYRIWAIPLWTAQEQLGSNGEYSVAAILRPLKVKKPRGKQPQGASLFDSA
jgi:hypothetical protein